MKDLMWIKMSRAQQEQVLHGFSDEPEMDDPAELRNLAEWYRAFAEVGRTEEREGRLLIAEYLDRKAKELEERGAT